MTYQGRKVVTAGEVFAASDMNSTIDQTVMVFAGTAARSSAIGTASEGMYTYLSDTNDTQFYNGSAWESQFGKGRNAIINGGMEFWQRGTSSAVGSGTYLADRWQAVRSGYAAGSTYSRQSAGLTGFTYAARHQRDSGNTSTAFLRFGQVLESATSIPLAGKTVTLSFYARSGGNFSAASAILKSYIISGTGTDQNVITGSFTGEAYATTNNTLTSSWTRFTLSYAVPSNATQLAIMLQYDPIGTAAASDYFEVTGVQLEEGSVATAFNRAGGTYQGELAACQRYYQRWSGSPDNVSSGVVNSTSGVYISLPTRVPMRTAGTLEASVASSATKVIIPNGVQYTVTSVALAVGGTNGVLLNAGIGSASLTYGQGSLLFINGGTDHISLTSEL